MKLIIAAALLLPIAAATPEPAAKPRLPANAHQAQAPVKPERAQMPNMMESGGPHCPSIARQIADASKRGRDRSTEARTLDLEPPAHLLLAVDRHIDGCRQVTFLRRNAAPGAAMPNPDPGDRRR